MTELATVQNVSAGPVLITPEGHVLGAGEFGTAAILTDHVRELVRAGLVQRVDNVPESNVAPAFEAAHRRTEELRAEQTRDDAPKGRKAATTTAQEA